MYSNYKLHRLLKRVLSLFLDFGGPTRPISVVTEIPSIRTRYRILLACTEYAGMWTIHVRHATLSQSSAVLFCINFSRDYFVAANTKPKNPLEINGWSSQQVVTVRLHDAHFGGRLWNNKTC